MCGIIGFRRDSKAPVAAGDFLKHLLLQSGIRGLHATGFTWLGSPEDEQLKTIKEPVSATRFVAEWPEIFEELPEVGLFHCRYSTSGDYTDSNNNQPLQNEQLAIVHNGIVSQAEPAVYGLQYGVTKLETANDSEIILAKLTMNYHNHLDRALAATVTELCQAKARPVFAVVAMDRNGELGAFRDDVRPLYYFHVPLLGLRGYCSTRDIFVRACHNVGLKATYIVELKPYQVEMC